MSQVTTAMDNVKMAVSRIKTDKIFKKRNY
jgi:hypothetical protein